jgi:hypothetical protein
MCGLCVPVTAPRRSEPKPLLAYRKPSLACKEKRAKRYRRGRYQLSRWRTCASPMPPNSPQSQKAPSPPQIQDVSVRPFSQLFGQIPTPTPLRTGQKRWFIRKAMHQPPSNHARIHGFSDGNRYRRGGWYGMASIRQRDGGQRVTKARGGVCYMALRGRGVRPNGPGRGGSGWVL